MAPMDASHGVLNSSTGFVSAMPATAHQPHEKSTKYKNISPKKQRPGMNLPKMTASFVPGGGGHGGHGGGGGHADSGW